MKAYLFFCFSSSLLLFFWMGPVVAKPVFSDLFLAQVADSAFDPFIDYGDFQDEVMEENTIHFFQKGRSFSLALGGGLEPIVFNIQQIYGVAPFFGAGIGFFVDFHFAFQVSASLPANHYNSLYNADFRFTRLGLDFKYYWNRQYVDEGREPINPYFILGAFWLNIDPSAAVSSSAKAPVVIPQTVGGANPPPGQSPGPLPNNVPIGPLAQIDRDTLKSHNSPGVKVGIGLEFAFIQQSFIGIEITYLYTELESENEDLSKRDLPPLPTGKRKNWIENFQFPTRPEVRGYRFYGDLINFGLFFGLNF